jgi:acyl-CoA thioester hydrolase
MFERQFMAGWGDIDFNSHMRNTAYLDKAVDVRMLFFAQAGFPMAEFARLRFGPVVMRDEVEYFREIGLLQTMTVSLKLAALAEDGSRFRMRNEFVRADGKRAAVVNSDGGWLDLAARKLITPPAALLEVLRTLPRTDDFSVPPSSIKP